MSGEITIKKKDLETMLKEAHNIGAWQYYTEANDFAETNERIYLKLKQQAAVKAMDDNSQINKIDYAYSNGRHSDASWVLESLPKHNRLKPGEINEFIKGCLVKGISK